MTPFSYGVITNHGVLKLAEQSILAVMMNQKKMFRCYRITNG
jgi:hypothetical protein